MIELKDCAAVMEKLDIFLFCGLRMIDVEQGTKAGSLALILTERFLNETKWIEAHKGTEEQGHKTLLQ